MPNDAKLGLVIGVSLVITVAVVFFKKEPPAASPAPEEASVSSAEPAPRSSLRTVPAHAVSRGDVRRSHVVQDGETLFSLAQRYYGSKDRFIDLYQANRDVLATPDTLSPGTTLVVPELPVTKKTANLELDVP